MHIVRCSYIYTLRVYILQVTLLQKRGRQMLFRTIRQMPMLRLALTKFNTMPVCVRTLMLNFSVSGIYVIVQSNSSHVLAYSAARQSQVAVNAHAQYLRTNSSYGLDLYTFAVSGSISEALRREARLASASALSASPAVPVLPFDGSNHEITCTTVTTRQSSFRHHDDDTKWLIG